jgi:HAD superfamily hydrolase (TIGR01549 family)
MGTIRAVLFDVIGTLVKEKDPTCVSHCFKEAFLTNGIRVDDDVIRSIRGKDKRDAIIHVLMEQKFSLDRKEKIYDDFKELFRDRLDNFEEKSEVAELVEFLRHHHMLVAIGSGLPKDLFHELFGYLNWAAYKFDYIGIAEDVGRGRPHPDMLLQFLTKFKLSPTALVKVGDTTADILEGRNAHVISVAIAAGTQKVNDLLSAKPDHLIHSLLEVKDIVLKS